MFFSLAKPVKSFSGRLGSGGVIHNRFRVAQLYGPGPMPGFMYERIRHSAQFGHMGADTNALTTAQVLEELIQIAKDIRAARARGEETGLSDEEIAFYDALAVNESARQMMGEPALRVIAHELVASIKGSVTVDWMHREAARARIRVLVKRILRKYGYPPDLQDAAVQTVLQQAEALSADWAA